MSSPLGPPGPPSAAPFTEEKGTSSQPLTRRLKLLLGPLDESLEQLAGAGIVNVPQYLGTSADHVAKSAGISAEVEADIRTRLVCAASAALVRADDMFDAYPETFSLLSTGFRELDKLLEGGYHSGELVELVGSAAVGKTQACLAAAAAASSRGVQVVYIDSSGGFSAERLLEYLATYADPHNAEAMCGELLQNIQVRHAFTLQELADQLDTVYIEATCGGLRQLRLIIVDSLAGLAMPSLTVQHSQGQVLLNHVGRLLLRMAHGLGLAALVTNFTVMGSNRQAAVKPALGVGWASMPTLRLHFRRLASAARVEAHLLKSGRLPTGGRAELDVSAVAG